VRARELVLTARLLDAEEARAIGLVTRIHPLADLEPKTRELAHEMATLAPLTQRAAKEATRRFLTLQTRALELDDLVLSCFLSEDFREGVRAFLEKRPARWQGR
jgi:enoyl-CoA hydratase/carnithine racemase